MVLRIILFVCGTLIALYLVSNLLQFVSGLTRDRRSAKGRPPEGRPGQAQL
jgi:hypothetical protein